MRIHLPLWLLNASVWAGMLLWLAVLIGALFVAWVWALDKISHAFKVKREIIYYFYHRKAIRRWLAENDKRAVTPTQEDRS